MNKNVIITISRQFGSNGREIGRQLAEYLDIGYYNKEIMEVIANDFGIDPDFFREENRNEQGLFSVAGRHKLSAITELSVNSEVYEKACELIQGISQRESAVIVGRWADYILKDHPNTIKLFIYSDLETRINWSISEYKVPARKARKFVHDKDERRAGFYEFYTGQKWGDAMNYDICFNSASYGIEESVDIIERMLNQNTNS